MVPILNNPVLLSERFRTGTETEMSSRTVPSKVHYFIVSLRPTLSSYNLRLPTHQMLSANLPTENKNFLAHVDPLQVTSTTQRNTTEEKHLILLSWHIHILLGIISLM